MNPVIQAVIPVRGGSERVKNKNLRPFSGSNLLAIKIGQLLQVKELDAVYVSSEDPTMLELAKELGAIPLERDPYYATSVVPMSEVYAYMAGQMTSEHVLLTHVTSPLAGAEVYRRCIEAYRNGIGQYDSLTTVSDVKDFLYQDGKPLNFDPAKKPRSQDLPEILKLTHVVSIASREMVTRTKEWFGPQVQFVKLDATESFDIDTPLDMEIAEMLYAKRAAQ
ncbi:MAG: acylneuraminate cytidylyltransferase family protein [Flavobacteriales bacterium]|mgnify:CR=1 FL=1|jgi:CMP-N-acetylneuraminic acid synthetase|nr:acylneuraminate cytidylyltransferase family protein [Flavobacteriales bacterium]MBK6551062.1 acylneuraminate cytidylyltransferase family protein [Flavobacteriales bacterium]MBK6882620.1 acylneuraminate cytidylyltransferase family protein [Flavobacteriales bacterium]MBK7111869.1 acylneuraminate cytidylyltransferase family protein [Flavobacteriales bacterium]MBK7482128.1 acylneuraminate cytidylyltransferase family protein [Flavobacteriales bacterium]